MDWNKIALMNFRAEPAQTILEFLTANLDLIIIRNNKSKLKPILYQGMDQTYPFKMDFILVPITKSSSYFSNECSKSLT